LRVAAAGAALVAGRPMRKALAGWLDAQLPPVAEFGLDADGAPIPSHLEFVVEHVAGGGTLLELTEQLKRDTQLPFHGQSIRRYLETKFGSDVVQRQLNEARGEAADALVEEAGQILDSLDETGSVLRTKEGGVILDDEGNPLRGSPDRDAIALAKHRADHRIFKASKFNRARYGDDQKGLTLQLNMQDLRIDGLRQFREQQLEPAGPIPALPPLTTTEPSE
jgi:hypothetical protein